MTTRAKQAEERAGKALELHLAGASYQSIADALGYRSKASAHEAVARAMAARPSQTLSEAIEQSLARLDTLLIGLWPKARRGDVAAVDRVLKIEARRAELLALTASQQPAAPPTDPLDELKARRDKVRAG